MLLFTLLLLVFPLLLLINIKSVKKFFEVAYRAYEPLQKIPGPKSLPLVGAVYQFKLNSKEFFEQLDQWHEYFCRVDPKRMGMVKLWLGPFPVVSVVWPDFIKTILESNTLLKKSNNYDIVRRWIGDGLLVSSGEKWQKRRKMLTPAFHFNVLRNYHEVFTRCGAMFVERLDEKADTNREVDIFPYLKRCAMDIICETAMGTRLDSQIGGNMEYTNAVSRLSDIIWSYQRFPHLWFPPIWYASRLGFEFDRLVKLTNNFTRHVIAERRSALIDEGILTEEDHEMTEAEIKRRKPCFLDLLLLMQRANALSDEDLREEVDTFMFEGHDTTSSAMGFATWLLGQYPVEQAKVQAELDEIFGDSDRQPDEADVKRMVYLERCIKESLRLAPSVPFVGRELQHDVAMAGVDLPKNLTMVISPYGPHLAPEHWERPMEFYPDHFTTEAASARHPYAYFPFSAGPRNCIGQKFALAEEKVVLSWLFRKFRVESVEPYPGADIVPEIVLKPQTGFKMRIFRRHH
ncbi:hypothetical protein PMAYCL1PPCAC_05940 [Pristionchus mayeri]|uniref:Cytochrome P450 n=1 Tax=Pristionchus mayeri TaxID=1317129 RepID=A0AAN4ZF01_9BILA|nr:hypothetical protein PMAYCL1PPCAC_05940 [Pristionchus mayeri]